MGRKSNNKRKAVDGGAVVNDVNHSIVTIPVPKGKKARVDAAIKTSEVYGKSEFNKLVAAAIANIKSVQLDEASQEQLENFPGFVIEQCKPGTRITASSKTLNDQGGLFSRRAKYLDAALSIKFGKTGSYLAAALGGDPHYGVLKSHEDLFMEVAGDLGLKVRKFSPDRS